MIDWMEMKGDEIDLLETASRFEREFPVFYRDSSNTRTATEAEMVAFYQNCERLFGIFKDGEFIGLVYFERIASGVTEVHLDVKRGASIAELVKPIAAIRDRQFQHGIRQCMAWTLKRNRGVQAMLAAIGFKYSGLTMRSGSSHGRALHWTQMLIAPRSFDRAEVAA